ncbi:MAG: hypothetical protein GC204_07430 [Chloroflexi bacterium]|nr:hypothetical protein [Chloroflexota bacterium]
MLRYAAENNLAREAEGERTSLIERLTRMFNLIRARIRRSPQPHIEARPAAQPLVQPHCAPLGRVS